MTAHRILRVLPAGFAAVAVVVVFGAGGQAAGPLKGCSGTWESHSEEITDPAAGRTAVYTLTTPIPDECDMSNGAYWSLQVVSTRGWLYSDHESVYGFPGHNNPPPPRPSTPCPPTCLPSPGATLERDASSGYWQVRLSVTGPSPNDVPRGSDEVFVRMFWYAGGVEGTAACLNRGRVHFGGVQVEERSKPERVTVSNCGTGEIDITSLSLPAAQEKDFQVIPLDCKGAKLASSEKCTFWIRFHPGKTGPDETAVTIKSSAQPLTVRADGLGFCPSLATLKAYRGIKCPFAVITPSNLDPSDVQPRDTGALDFGSVEAGKSASMKLTVENGGDAPLHIRAIKDPTGAGFEKDLRNTTCTATPLQPGATCQVGVSFSPKAHPGERAGELEIEDDAPGGTQYVSLRGTATTESLQPTSVAPEQGTQYNPATCAGHGLRVKDLPTWAKVGIPAIIAHGLAPPLLGVPAAVVAGGVSAIASYIFRDAELYTLGWAPLQGRPTRLVGQVLESHVATLDMVGITDHEFHHNSDLDVFVYPDHGYRYMLARPGEFKVGGEYSESEKGRMTVESETFNPSDPALPGLPPWAWPTTGDKLDAIGVHIFDCGHGKPDYRSEIHPVEFIATYRNAALTPGASTSGLGSYDPTTKAKATRVDVFASSYGGPAYGVQIGERGEEWQATHGPYEFDVLAPPQPTATAELAEPEILHREGAGDLTYTKLSTGRGYRFELKLPPGHSHAGYTVWVEWRDPQHPDKVKANLHGYRVVLHSLRVLHLVGVNALGASVPGRLGLYASMNEVKTQSLLSGGRNELHQSWREVDAGSTISLASAPSLYVELVDRQSLHVEFRVTSWKEGFPIGYWNCCGDYGSGFALGTTGRVFTPAELPQLNGQTITQYGGAELPNQIGPDELDEKCDKSPCYQIAYSVTRVN